MREATFNSEVVNSIKHWGGWAHKIADLPASLTFGLRYVPEKPCDILACYHNRFFAVEGKQLKKFEAFGLRHMEHAQIKELTDIVKRGNKAFVFLNIRIKAVKGKTKHENRLIILPWEKIRDLKETIKQKEIMALPYVSYQNVKKDPRDKDGQIIYDLKAFLESI